MLQNVYRPLPYLPCNLAHIIITWGFLVNYACAKIVIIASDSTCAAVYHVGYTFNVWSVCTPTPCIHRRLKPICSNLTVFLSLVFKSIRKLFRMLN